MLFIDRLTIQDTCRLTDTTYPVKSYLTTNSFPAQDASKLGTEGVVAVRSYKNGFKNDNIYDHEYHLDHVKYYTLRYDTEYPYTIIGIGNHGTKYRGSILIIDNTPSEDHDHKLIAVYPVQQYNYYNAYTKNVYSDFSNLADGTNGIIVRADDAEPAHAVVAEITKDSKLRFITSEEAIILLDDFQPKTEIYHELDIYNIIEQLLGEYQLYGSNDQ